MDDFRIRTPAPITKVVRHQSEVERERKPHDAIEKTPRKAAPTGACKVSTECSPRTLNFGGFVNYRASQSALS